MSISKVLDKIKLDWTEPRYAFHRGKKTYSKLSCSFMDEGEENIDIEFKKFYKIPNQLIEFWKITKSAKLFEDTSYGQWGLIILSPRDALELTNKEKKRRPNEFKKHDLIVGEFIGDSELLLIRCGENYDDFENILVSLPIDPRSEWYNVSNSLEDFLEKYLQSEGDKYWEP